MVIEGCFKIKWVVMEFGRQIYYFAIVFKGRDLGIMRDIKVYSISYLLQVMCSFILVAYV